MTPAVKKSPLTRRERLVEAMLEDRLRYAERSGQVRSHAEAELRAQAERDVASTIAAELKAVEDAQRPLLSGPRRYEAFMTHLAAIAHAYDVTLALAVNEAGHAFADRREARAPLVADDCDYSVALHEVGHAANPCPRTGDHFRDPDGKRRGCIACEVQAWEFAMTHALTWTDDMHRHLDASISTYRRSSYGTPAAFSALDAIVSVRAFREEQQRRLKLQHERDLQNPAFQRPPNPNAVPCARCRQRPGTSLIDLPEITPLRAICGLCLEQWTTLSALDRHRWRLGFVKCGVPELSYEQTICLPFAPRQELPGSRQPDSGTGAPHNLMSEHK